MKIICAFLVALCAVLALTLSNPATAGRPHRSHAATLLCAVDSPMPEMAVGWTSDVLFDGDVTCQFLFRRRVQQGETGAQFEQRITDSLDAFAEAAGYEDWCVDDNTETWHYP